MAAQTTQATTSVSNEQAIADFQTALRGDLIQPGDPSYDEGRAVFNGMIDRHPRLITRCVDTADVIAAVTFAREQELTVAIRSGGHNAAGLGTVENGLVIDLAPMNGVHVDPERRTARVEGGCTWGDVDHATHAFGLAVPSGIISTTGVGGLTLGGGFGHLSRSYGLTCDNLISAEVVTADGNVVTASADDNADLYWALRGGGGNFGVVTSFEFTLHPVDTVLGGPIFYPIDQSEEVLRFYREFIAEVPENMSAFFGFHIAPPAPFVPEHLHNVPVAAIVPCHNHPQDGGEAALRPLKDEIPPLLDLTSELPYPALNSMFDALQPPGLHQYWKADFVRELSDEAIDIHLQYGPKVPTVPSVMHIYPLDGAVNDVANDETAFSYRDAEFAHVILAADDNSSAMPAHIRWTRDYWEALHPLSAGGAYVNMMMEEGQDRIRASYRGNYDRLSAIKAIYDPTNFFHVNQNIEPAS